MTQGMSPEDLGEPAPRVAGLQLWIHARQIPEATDYDEGWVFVTAPLGGRTAIIQYHLPGSS